MMYLSKAPVDRKLTLSGVDKCLGARQQRGLYVVEFAIVGGIFFLVLFAVIEVGRLLFTWNILADVTRRAARIAAVCPVNHSGIAPVAIYNGPTGTGASPIINGLTTGQLKISYLDADGVELGDPAGIPNYFLIEYVKAEIDPDSPYQHELLIPGFWQTIDAPAFATVLPRESLGVPREDVPASCF